jgi:peptidylprolyl isomerase
MQQEQQAKQGDTVTVHYTGKLKDGTVFGTSVNSQPLQFTLGEQQVIPGFERAVMGMIPGETKTIEIPAEQAYGERRDDMMVAVDREQLPADMEPEVGQQLQINQDDMPPRIVTITNVEEESVVLDANHPLAGHDLIFDIQLMEIA